MKEIFIKKNIYHKNSIHNIQNVLKKNGIINSNIITRIKSPEKNEFLKYLNKKEFSNEYIYSKAKKKIK